MPVTNNTNIKPTGPSQADVDAFFSGSLPAGSVNAADIKSNGGAGISQPQQGSLVAGPQGGTPGAGQNLKQELNPMTGQYESGGVDYKSYTTLGAGGGTSWVPRDSGLTTQQIYSGDFGGLNATPVPGENNWNVYGGDPAQNIGGSTTPTVTELAQGGGGQPGPGSSNTDLTGTIAPEGPNQVAPGEGDPNAQAGQGGIDDFYAAVAGKIITGEIDYTTLSQEDQAGFLDSLHKAAQTDPNLISKITDPNVLAAYNQAYNNSDINGGSTTGGGTNVGDHNANKNFQDQGDGVYRGWKSQGPENMVNTTQADGSVQGNYRDARGNEFRADAVTADSMGNMSVEDAAAATAAANNRSMTQEEMSAKQLNDILSQGSPLMTLARQDGINMANSRGLMNSSLAAGASMAEMARQATPLAMQQAEAYRQMEAQNQGLESSRLESNAGREQQTGLFNADSQNKATSQEFGTEADLRKFNAATQTSTNTSNASMANDMLNADRQRTFSYAMQQLAGDQDYAKQTLASNKAIDLANVEGQYKSLISENDTAARMFDSTYSSIADILSNTEIHADEAGTKVDYLVNNMKAMMDSLLAFDNFDFTDYQIQGPVIT